MAGTMSALTAALIGALVVYGGGWFVGWWIGNFSLLLFVLTVVTFGYWLAERVHFRPRRLAAAAEVERQETARREQLQRQGIVRGDSGLEEAREKLLMEPWWVEWTAGLFPVIAIVFVLRSFLFEPFKIPSGSMVPTLLVGDLILVNKFTYGVRLPVVNVKVIPRNDPQRGDVIVFRYPPDPRLDYIKRVVGVPGDEVEWINQRLSINGQPVALQPLGEYYDEDSLRYAASSSTPSATRSWPAPTAAFPSTRTAATPPRACAARCPKGITSSWVTTVTIPRTHATGASCRTATWWARPS
jgi:signal peptidase I